MSNKRKSETSVLKARVIDYVLSNGIRALRDKDVTAIVSLPVEATKETFLEVSDLPSLSDLPRLPERMRDFAYRSGIEYKPDRDWAPLFSVDKSTITRWKNDPRVAQIRALTKYERRAYQFGQMLRIERNMYNKIDALLNTKITGDTAAPILQTIKFAWSILNGNPDISTREKGQFNINIGMGKGQQYDSNAPSAFREERDVTPDEAVVIEKNIQRAEAIVTQYNAFMTSSGDGSGDNGDK